MAVDLDSRVRTVTELPDVPTIESLNPMDSQARGRIETVRVDIPGAGLP